MDVYGTKLFEAVQYKYVSYQNFPHHVEFNFYNTKNNLAYAEIVVSEGNCRSVDIEDHSNNVYRIANNKANKQ